jgi:hypothetical protein
MIRLYMPVIPPAYTTEYFEVTTIEFRTSGDAETFLITGR